MSDIHSCISEDIWFEILTKLPVKTLGRWRCVCKSWDSLIDSPSFMAAHLKSYTLNEANSLLLRRHMIPREFPHYVYRFFLLRKSTNVNGLNSILDEAYHTLVCSFKTPGRWNWDYDFVGSINGLLCLSKHDSYKPVTSQIVIWNPLVRKHINIPQSMWANNSSLGDHIYVLGFGYHGKNNDYRVVKIIYEDGSTTFIPLVEVYSVQERAWRTISSDFMFKNSINDVSSSHCFLNGVIHWLTWTITRPALCKWLLLFNVEEEKFEKMEMPDAPSQRDCRCSIFEYQNKLAVSICDYYYLTCSKCRIWVKEDYNVKSSWCKVLDVTLNRMARGNPIEYLDRNGKLSETGQTENLGRLSSSPIMFSSYTETLALLDQKTDV